MLVCVYTCQNATLLEITCQGSSLVQYTISTSIKHNRMSWLQYSDCYDVHVNYIRFVRYSFIGLRNVEKQHKNAKREARIMARSDDPKIALKDYEF